MSDGSGRESGMAAGRTSPPPTTDSIFGEAVDRTRQAGTQAVDLANDLTQDLKTRSKSLLDDTTGHIASAAKEQKDGLANQMDDVAKSVHRPGEQLEEQYACMQAADDALRAEGLGKAHAAADGSSANPGPSSHAGGAPLGSV